MVETKQVLGTTQDGQDILLTIDQVIQHITERELVAAVQRTGAKGGWAVVIDPMTGEILAMATVPAFDPNSGPDTNVRRWVNRPVAEAQEPGSTFKIFLMAAALDSGVVPPTERFFCGGALPAPGGVVLPDARGGRRGGGKTRGKV